MSDSPTSAVIRCLKLCACGLLLGWICVSVGVSAEKREAAEKKDAAVDDIEKPPLGQITVLIPDKKFKAEGKNKALRISFDDLDIERVLNTKKLSLDLPEKMPEWMKKLHGQRVRLRGYMHPASAFTPDGIKRFVIVRSTAAMSFGPSPRIDLLAEVRLRAGTTTEYVDNKPIDVEGILRINPKQFEMTDEIDQFYLMDDVEIIPVEARK